MENVGDSYRNFRLIRIIPIPEIQCVLKEMEHLPTGAQVMAIANDDPENLFCLSFRTWPKSSDGVAHILEHTVLCGSEEFPVKDPFFAMARRSLNTFMNALTGSDFTCYPAASQVPQDFYNLLEVYLDAVFKPLLNELSFRQEGHRLEFSTQTDPNTALTYKGVVYNEMKGALASSTSRLNELMNLLLFPDLTYGVNSGGDPKDIPNLTYEELKGFHSKYYHPSRCLFFFYGNLPLEKNLDFIADRTLDVAAKMPQLPSLPFQPRFKEPKIVHATFPIAADDPVEDQTLIGFGWLTCPILNQQEWLALSVLGIVILDTDASPLKRALLDSGLCKQVSSYLDGEISEVPWVIVLRGCKPHTEGELRQVINRSLNQLIEEGIPDNLVENAIHQLEFDRSEITGDHSPYGLSLFFRSALLKQHGGEPESGLKIHSLFYTFRQLIQEKPDYLLGLIKKYLLENTHSVTVVMEPDKNLGAKEAEEERRILNAIQEKLTPAQAEEIVKKSLELEEFQKRQEDEEDVDVLPKISLQDIPLEPRYYPLNISKLDHLRIFHHPTFTNEILYADLSFDLPDLPYEDLPYVRLFTTLASQVGCGTRNWAQNLDYIQAHTGGVGISLTLNLQAQDHTKFFPAVNIRGKALHRKGDRLLSLMGEMATSLDFNDTPRLKELIMKHYTGLQSTLNQNALKYAINLSASSLNVASKIANAWYGLDYFYMIRELAQDFDDKVEELQLKLNQLKDQILCIGQQDLITTCSAEYFDYLVKNKFWGLTKLPQRIAPAWKGNYPLDKESSQARAIATPIAFTGKVFNTISYIDPSAPALNLAAFMFDNITLHSRIREQGGAYGAGAVNNALSGNFYFYSYRDPHIASTLEAFEHSAEEIAKGEFDFNDLEEARIEMIQALDGPISPGSRADLAYGWLREGRTMEVRQAFRDRILSLTPREVQQAVKDYILPNMHQGATVVFAGRELIEKENLLLEASGRETLPIHSI